MSSGSIRISIDGDDSALKKKLSGINTTAKAGLADIKAGIDMTTAALKGLASVAEKGINYNATMESYKTSFEVMTGSAEKATEVVERLRELGASTPFETTDLVKTTQLLMQYGFTADEAIDRMSMLGDIAQGNADAMNSIAMGYAQMSSAGKVNLQDIRQMINGGFNPLQEISERTGESMESLYDRISSGTLSIEEITESMQAATSAGGKFYQSMEKQSQTLSGQLSTLQDNANELLGSITQGMADDMSAYLLPMANNMIAELQDALKNGGMDGLVDTATDMIPDLLGMMTGKLQDAISGMSRWMPKAVNSLMSTLPSAIKGGTQIIPQITSALFEVASVVISDLVTMLPELAPALLKGIADLGVSIAEGTFKMFDGLLTGVSDMIGHLNQEFISDGVNMDALKNLDFKMDLDMDTSAATSEISTAYSEIREALQTELLTQEQKDAILEMIGSDASEIKAKLMEFGIPSEEAASIAETISNGGQTIIDALNALNVGADAKTILKWYGQAKGSNVALRHCAEAAGLSGDEIDTIIGLYNEMNGRLSTETPNIAETIYAALTDGLADDETTVSGLKEQVEGWASDRMTEIEEGYEAALAKLDPTAPDYNAKVAELTAQYEQAKSDVETIKSDSLVIIDNLAGQSTAAVQAAYEDIAAIETAMSELETRVAALKGEALSAAENAYKVVTAGGKADDATISMAVSLKFNEFKVDEQAAQDTYDETIAKLNEQFAQGEITKAEFDTGVLNAEATKTAAVNAAKDAFERSYAAILRGIAESEGNAAAFTDDTFMKAKAAEIVSQMMDSIAENGAESVTPEQKSAVSQMLTDIFGGESFSVEEMDLKGMGPVLMDAYTRLTDDIDTSVLSGKVQEVYTQALNDGILVGTGFDTDSKSEAVATLFSTIYSGASGSVNEAAKSLATGATENMDDASGARASGKDTVDGLISGLSSGISRARTIGKLTGMAYASAYSYYMDQHSPSRRMLKMGKDTGKGLEIGLSESISDAVQTANMLMGGLSTSADITRRSLANMPAIQQEISIANEQAQKPVYLNGKQIATIQGTNNTNELAWLRAKDARGYGYR